MNEDVDLSEALLTVAVLANTLASRVAVCEANIAVLTGAFAHLVQGSPPVMRAEVVAYLRQPIEALVGPGASETVRDGVAEIARGLQAQIEAMP